MSDLEQPVVFECAGETLLGIVAGASIDSRVGVLVVVGGPQYRIGSHRQYVTLTRHLARHGIPAMRFDYRGMGDSSGAMRAFDSTDTDIAAAMEAFTSACPTLEHIVLWGLCDAASANLMYWDAMQDPRVAGMVLVDPWVSEVSFAKRQMRHYLKRLLQGEFWLKLARGGVDVVGALKSFAFAVSTARPIKQQGPDGLTESELAIRMAGALSDFPGLVLIILSGDLAAKNFVEHCQNGPLWDQLVARGTVEAREFPDANHTFSTAADRARVESLTCDWIKTAFAASLQQ